MPKSSSQAGQLPSRDSLLSTLDFTLPVTPAPASYALAVAGMVAFLILLSILYLTLAAFLLWLFAWHIYQTIVTFSQGPYFLFHLPMALLGGILLVFLVKPVFFRRRAHDQSIITLAPDDQPLLFDFIHKLCATTGAPPPAAIEVDCDSNASVRLRKPTLNALAKNNFVLRIGLPLVAAMPVQHFAGILAHEFGHFKQTSGMHGSYLIRHLIAFFAKIVFERDRLDEKLHRLRYSTNAASRLLFWCVGWFIESVRGVLWLLLMAAQFLTCHALRKMEFDADLVEAHVAGTRSFIITNKLMLFLAIATRRARHDLADAWEQRRLADNLPKLIVAHARQLSEHRDDILQIIEKETTGWLDTHPCHNDRIQNVQIASPQALLNCDTPAKNLFSEFEPLCKRASEAFYRSVIGPELAGAQLIPTAQLVEQRQGEKGAFKALKDFFLHGAAVTRPILPAEEVFNPINPDFQDKVFQQIIDTRTDMATLAPAAGIAARKYEAANAGLVFARNKAAFARLFNSRAATRLARASAAEIPTLEKQRLQAVRDITMFESTARERLTAALRLAFTPPWLDDPQTAQLPRSLFNLVTLVRHMQPHLANIERLRECAIIIRLHLNAYDSARPFGPLVRRIIETGDEVRQILNRIRADLSQFPYPFAHANKNVTAASSLFEKIPPSKDPGDLYAVAVSTVDRFYDLLYRALAEITERAQKVEQSLGLELIPIPPEPVNPLAEQDRKTEFKQETRNKRRYWIGNSFRAAAGLALLITLVNFSINPPFHFTPWDGDSSNYATRPRSFSVTPYHKQVPGDPADAHLYTPRTYPLPANPLPPQAHHPIAPPPITIPDFNPFPAEPQNPTATPTPRQSPSTPKR